MRKTRKGTCFRCGRLAGDAAGAGAAIEERHGGDLIAVPAQAEAATLGEHVPQDDVGVLVREIVHDEQNTKILKLMQTKECMKQTKKSHNDKQTASFGNFVNKLEASIRTKKAFASVPTMQVE